MLIATHDGVRVDARRAVKGARHECPGCGGEVVLHRGTVVAAHFKHKPEHACDWARGETIAHLTAKDIFRSEFERRGIRAETEFVVDTLPGDRRADLMLWTPGGSMVAIELQQTPADPRNIAARVASYARVGIRQCWIPFVKDDVWKKGRATATGWIRSGYTPSPYEEWLHKLHGNKGLWMFDRRDGSVWLTSLRPHMQFKEYKVYYDTSGEERSSGGYEYAAKKKRDLHMDGPHPISSIIVDRQDIASGKWRTVAWPEMRIALLRLAAPGELASAADR